MLDDRAETLLEGLVPLSDDLGEVLDALRELRSALRDEVTEADRVRTAAEQAARDADERAEQTLRGQRTAEADAATAGDRAGDAETGARQATTAADTQVREVVDRLAAVERERGEAIAARAYAQQNAQAATGRADAAEQVARTSRELADALRDELALARQDLADTRTWALTAEHEAAHSQRAHTDLSARAEQAATEAAAALTAMTAERDRAGEAITALGKRLRQLEQQSAAADQRATDLQPRASHTTSPCASLSGVTGEATSSKDSPVPQQSSSQQQSPWPACRIPNGYASTSTQTTGNRDSSYQEG